MYLNLKPQKFEICIYVKGKLKTHFFLQIFIYMSVEDS